jgi:hypothetical protein
MKAKCLWMFAAALVLGSSYVHDARADEAAPEWQTPGYVMDEIVVKAKAPSQEREQTRREVPEICL